jgi:hypothetical protein
MNPFCDSLLILPDYQVESSNACNNLINPSLHEARASCQVLNQTLPERDQLLHYMVSVGGRVCDSSLLGCKGARGTVRYIGSLEDKKGEWVGVEWDDIDRGKHSGCWKGTRMFFCQKEGNVASFVRREKLQPGIDLLEACALRYLNQGDSLHALKDMQFVGLKGYPAASIGDSTKLSLALSNLKSLDLSCCLLSSWDQIIELGTALSSLYELDISNNTLQDLKEDQIIPPSLFPNLARLIVDTMGENACKNVCSW